MDPFEQLGLIAEIAATYSGFIAVFIAFSGRDGRFSPADSHFVQAMVLTALGAIVFSLAPRALSLFATESWIWTGSSSFAVFASAAAGVFIARHQITMPSEEAQTVSSWWHVPGWTLGTCTVLSFLAALLTEDRAAFYVVGATFALINAIWCFMAIVFRKFF